MRKPLTLQISLLTPSLLVLALLTLALLSASLVAGCSPRREAPAPVSRSSAKTAPHATAATTPSATRIEPGHTRPEEEPAGENRSAQPLNFFFPRILQTPLPRHAIPSTAMQQTAPPPSGFGSSRNPVADPAPQSFAAINTSDRRGDRRGDRTNKKPKSETTPAPKAALMAPGMIKPPEDDQSTLLRIGLLLPLTGSNSELGRDMLSAAQHALFDLDNPRLVIFPRDTGGTEQGAVNAANEALEAGAEILLGPLLASSVSAAAPLARRRDVNLIAFSTDRSVVSNGVFLISFTAEEQVTRILTFAHRRGIRRVAVLAPDTPYGHSVAEAARSAAMMVGAEIVRAVFYPAIDPPASQSGGSEDDEFSKPLSTNDMVRELADYDRRHKLLTDLKDELDKQIEQGINDLPALGYADVIGRAKDPEDALLRLKGRDTLEQPDFDAVLLPEGGKRLQAIAALLPYYDIDPQKIKILGTGLWDDRSVGQEPALVDGWYAAPSPQGFNDFSERMTKTWGRTPSRIASLAYDAVALVGALALQADEQGSDFGKQARSRLLSTDALQNPDGFTGTDGIFRFRPDGTSQRGMAIMTVKKSGPKILDPAPTGFEITLPSQGR